MTFQQRRRDFLGNVFDLSRYENAAFSAAVVAIGLAINHWVPLGVASGAFIIGAQSVTGVNLRGPLSGRLRLAATTASILFACSCLGGVAGQLGLPVAIVCGILLAFSFGWWRQIFPDNWPQIVFPSSVMFFLGFSHPSPLAAAAGVTLGFAFEILLGIGMYLRRGRSGDAPLPEEAPLPPSGEAEATVLGLKRYLFIYGIELSLLLAIGFVAIRFSGFPHSYWLPLTCVLVLKVGRHKTLRRVVERTLGTIGGCLLAGTLLYLRLPPLLSAAALTGCMFLWLCFLKQRYAVAAIFITAFVLTLLGAGAPPNLTVLAERLGFTAAGGALALLSSRIFLEKERR